ncbi:hypothetical protein PICMEDRAFT_71427 [Pichia membranifaciens NRRL Y-2026]|uniref:Non-structural maintenance of chromosomes element 1 homolog n=1 Tax=Pichia membranifaciens NRRL Y-2026 TaxID=763406 RepID=A0A1E3NMJ7_9ASCO|nr:hypothetical protein PICMEDRAFT_71427 [Pichia membranifaciens NRRL Y-2026]ODQ47347.1 hypothetical protein PICMEDRAFT_71427 [Pichia membranifaciens NRRL Y-2026]
MSEVVPHEFMDLHTGEKSYTALHAAMVDLVMSVRTIRQTSLLLYLKKALVTLYIDQEQDPSTIESLRSLVQSDDPLPDVDLSILSTILTSINTRLEPLDMEIAESKDMDDSSVNIFSFVNKKPTGAIRLSTKYSQNDVQLVKQVIERIFASEYVNSASATDEEGTVHPRITFSVPCMKMIKYLRDGPRQLDDDDAPVINRFTLEEADLFLKDLECYGWLERNLNNYTLAPRGLVELKKYLIDTYGKCPEGTVSVCYGCGDILTRGIACSNASCHVHFHRYCCELVQKSRDDNSCPNDGCSETFESFYSF